MLANYKQATKQALVNQINSKPTPTKSTFIILITVVIKLILSGKMLFAHFLFFVVVVCLCVMWPMLTKTVKKIIAPILSEFQTKFFSSFQTNTDDLFLFYYVFYFGLLVSSDLLPLWVAPWKKKTQNILFFSNTVF